MHESDYLRVLEAINTLDFGVGKALLGAILIGGDHDSIERNDLTSHDAYESLAYTESEVLGLIEQCQNHGLIEYQQLPHKPNIRVLALTDDGEQELNDPTHPIPVPDIPYTNAEPSSAERELIDEFDFFLDGYNDAQQRAIICPDETVLCVAGAGTGKTTVLTKRIEYLTKYTDTDPADVLAITFTRKARDEMRHRLSRADVTGVNIHTFNSYAEHLIRTYMDDSVRDLIGYQDKLRLLHHCLDETGHSVDTALDIYYSDQQQRSKAQNQLINGLLRDTTRLITQNKLNDADLNDLNADTAEQRFLKSLAQTYQDELRHNDYRLHADQLLNGKKLLQARPQHYDHVLIDEYQDVNDAQVDMINRLNNDHLFCVGDPRQSIYGWRGSRIEHTTKFRDDHPDATIITLTKNYRSKQRILDAANKTIRPMLLPPVQPTTEDNGTLTPKRCDTRDDEHSYVAKTLSNRDHPVLVLARRNKQLTKLSDHLTKHGIDHTVKETSDDTVTSTTILATIHAVKGLEAPTVILIGARSTNHPLRVSDHPLLDQLQPDTYDREAEERRLFYVAETRAENELIITWTGRQTTYLTTPRRDTDDEDNAPTKSTEDRLKEWRKEQSEAARVPEFKILPNSTLRTILKDKPRTRDDLKSIWGFTPDRIEKYGEDILNILNA